MEQNNKIVLFQEQQIRRVWHDNQWYFSILDIVETLTDSSNPTDYFKKMRKREDGLKTFVGTNCPYVEMESKEGKKRKTLTANTEGVLRIVMSIPSTKAEPFKLWLAQVGQERIEEIENPELGIERVKELYAAKGYPPEWIDMRIQSIEARKQLTDEWKKRDVQEGKEYSILTAQIAKATFGLTPTEHKKLKGLERQNLRDHMTLLELLFTQLGEELTRKVAVENNATGFDENSTAAHKGGKAAGKARIVAEKETGIKVVSPDNFLKQIEETQKKKQLSEDKDNGNDEKS
jgi:DNA-damage-inducible protein D